MAFILPVFFIEYYGNLKKYVLPLSPF